MRLTIGIHDSPDSFSARWFEYCDIHNIPHVKLDMFDTDFIKQLRHREINVFLFHNSLFDTKNQLVSSYIVRALEMMGIKVFPCDANYWHFDDKIAQKYLFESLCIPMCQTWVFFDREVALDWATSASYPKIFKLRRGAGSHNVKMITSATHAIKIIKQMFNTGTKPVSGLMTDYKTKLYKHKKQRDWIDVAKRLPATLANIKNMQMSIPRERGYVYFQDYLPGNTYDTRDNDNWR